MVDAEVTAAHRTLFANAIAAGRTIERVSAPWFATMSQVWRRRMVRLAPLAVGAAWLTWWCWPPPPLRVDASSAYSANYPASAVIDGKVGIREGEWLLLEKATGWVRVRLHPAQQVAWVAVENAGHPPFFTYGTKDFRVRLLHGGRLIREVRGTFPPPRARLPAYELALPQAVSADTIEIWVDSYHGAGGGIAEVRWSTTVERTKAEVAPARLPIGPVNQRGLREPDAGVAPSVAPHVWPTPTPLPPRGTRPSRGAQPAPTAPRAPAAPRERETAPPGPPAAQR